MGPAGLIAFPTPEGVWATDPTGALLPVAISGQSLEINGMTKVVDTARLDRFLDDGRLLVLLGFTDRRDGGLYAVTIVPEPGAVAWVVGAIALLARRRNDGARMTVLQEPRRPRGNVAAYEADSATSHYRCFAGICSPGRWFSLGSRITSPFTSSRRPSCSGIDS